MSFQTVRFRRPAPSPVITALFLTAAAAAFLHDGSAASQARALAGTASSSLDREAARFVRCGAGARFSCVVDGDTFWYRGDKIRIADINAPEVSKPACLREARLGQRATERLTQLLNSGEFTLERDTSGRERDRYGRLLRQVTRNGKSLGARLTTEGLAERWTGRRRDWC